MHEPFRTAHNIVSNSLQRVFFSLHIILCQICFSACFFSLQRFVICQSKGTIFCVPVTDR